MFKDDYLNPMPPTSTWLHFARALAHVREYIQAIHALILSTFGAPFDETIRCFCLLHPLAKIDLHPFVDDFHPKTKVILNWKPFIFVLACSPRLSFDGPLNMGYELSKDYFVLDDFMNGFYFFFKVCGHIAWGHVPPSVLHFLSASQLLTLEK
jgi:hypothetical protein